MCHTYGLRARVLRSRTQSRYFLPPTPLPFFLAYACLPACCLLARSFPFSSPLSPARLTPPTRYRYHNNGIIAIPAAYYTMTLATMRRGSPQRPIEYTRKQETGLVRPNT